MCCVRLPWAQLFPPASRHLQLSASSSSIGIAAPLIRNPSIGNPPQLLPIAAPSPSRPSLPPIRLPPPPNNLLLPVLNAPVLLLPPARPHAQILQHALRPSRPHPNAQQPQRAPEHDAEGEPDPEEDGVEQHVEEFEGEDEDEEEQGEGGEVGFLREGVGEGCCVGFEEGEVGGCCREDGGEVGAERGGGGEEVAGPVCERGVRAGLECEGGTGGLPWIKSIVSSSCDVVCFGEWCAGRRLCARRRSLGVDFL